MAEDLLHQTPKTGLLHEGIQRFNSPSLLSIHRVILQSHQLSNGTILPKGAHVNITVNAIQNDPAVTPEPDVFDDLRYYKLRR